VFERDESVGIDDRVIIEGDVGRPGRHCPYCDDDHVGIMFGRRAGLLNEKPVRIDKAGLSKDQIDAVARHLVLHDLNFVLDDVVGAKREIFDRDRFFETIAGSIQVALAEPREVENRFSEGFAGDSTGVGRNAADDSFALDDAALQARIDSLAAQVGGAEALSAWQTGHGYSEQTFRSALRRAAESAWMRDKIISNVPSTAEQVHVQQILLYNQDTAQNFLAQLNGGADFDELAFKADPLTRGDLGWVPRGYLLNLQIEEAAFNLSVDQFSDVIATDVGFHIVKILARDPNRPLSPDALLSLQELALRKWVEEQRSQASVVLAPQ